MRKSKLNILKEKENSVITKDVLHTITAGFAGLGEGDDDDDDEKGLGIRCAICEEWMPVGGPLHMCN